MGTPIGRILLMPKGDWNSATTYNALDWVRDSGAAWVCTTDNTTNVKPTLSTPEWQLMAEDGSVGGWSSINNKPFDTIGKGLTVNLLDELEVAAKNTYIGTGTSSDRPISGQGVADAIATEITPKYYTKTDVDDKLKVVVKYAGRKTFAQLTSSLLVSTNENNFFMLSDAGYITSANVNYWNDNFVVGDHVLKDSHIAVIEYTGSDPNKSTYVFDDFGGFVEVDEYTSLATCYTSSGDVIVVFDNLNPAYGYDLEYYLPDETGTLPTADTELTIPTYTKIKRMTNADSTLKLTFVLDSNATSGVSQFALRIKK